MSTKLIKSDELYDERFNKIESIAHIGTWERDLRTGKVRWSNELYRICGFEPNSFKPTMEMLYSLFSPGEYARLKAEVDRSIKHKSKFSIETKIYKNNELSTWVVAEGDVICDEAGEPCTLIGYLQDITERKKTEIQLAENEQMFRSLFEESGIAAAMADRDGRFIKANKKMCALFGYSSEEFIRLTFDQITYAQDIGISTDLFNKLMRNEISHYQLEKRYEKKDGTVFWGLLNISAVFGMDGKAKYMVGKIIDIDSSKKATVTIMELNARLSALNKQKDKLFSVIAHDLKNPIWASKLLVDQALAYKDIFTKEDLLKKLVILQKSTSTVYELMEELLLWSTNQLQVIGYKPVMLEVNEQLNEIIRIMRYSYEKKGIKVIWEAEAGLRVYADKEMLRTVLRNLVSNAI